MRSAVILAGGNSRRLGTEKSLLEFERRPLICWTIEKLSLAADEVVVVARSEAHAWRLEEIISNFSPEPEPKVTFTWDSVAGFGPVAGLFAGMKKASGSLAFATGCDLPFLNPQVIERLFELADEEDSMRLRFQCSLMDFSSRFTAFTIGEDATRLPEGYKKS